MRTLQKPYSQIFLYDFAVLCPFYMCNAGMSVYSTKFEYDELCRS